MAGPFDVFESGHKGGDGKLVVTKIVVNDRDIAGGETRSRRPNAAEFPISELYDFDTQVRRAQKFAEYMNKMAEIMADLEKDQGL